MSDAARRRSVCQALLRPSPWYRVDVGGDGEAVIDQERARQARLDEVLGPLEGDERALVFRCVRDAHDAQVPGGREGAQAGSMRTRMVHPLSAELVRTLDEGAWQAWFRAEEEVIDWFAGETRGAGGEVSETVYRCLWRRLMCDQPHAPGSLWLPDHDISAHRSLAAALLAARLDESEPALLYLHLGPVQGFIASARRTHDLWIGSYTVAYLSLRAAVAIAEHSGPQAVVLPALAHVPAAAPLLFEAERRLDHPIDRRCAILQERLRSSLSNKIVAVVACNRAEDAARQAAAAARRAWRGMGTKMRDRLKSAAREIPAYEKDGDRGWKGFDEQLDAHLEIDAVVQPWPADLAAMRARLKRLDVRARAEIAPERDEAQGCGAAYGALYDLGHRALAAHRKAVMPAWSAGDQRPKCSQCGQREQMGPVECSPYERRKALDELSRTLDQKQKSRDGAGAESSPGEERRESLQLTRGEGLCAVCLTKRFAPVVFYADADAELGVAESLEKASERERRRRLLGFPSTYSIASAPFRARVLQAMAGHWRPDQRASVQRVVERWSRAVNDVLAKNCLDFTPPGNLLPGLDQWRDVPAPAELMTLDGQWLYESTYQPETAWLDHYPERAGDKEQKDRMEKLRGRLPAAFEPYRDLCKRLEASPSSYFAVLVLDGDQMGKWLTGRHPKMPELAELAANQGAPEAVRPLYPALHGELSQRLAGLARALHGLVEETYLGRVVYSGGDDLLAFLPAQTALPCLRAVERLVRQAKHLGGRVTVSAGLAISHVRAPLGPALHEAREAESAAKRAGGAHLAVHVLERSGAPLRVTLPWRADGAATPDTLDTLWSLLDPRAAAGRASGESVRDDGDPLLRVAGAHRLEAELAELGGAHAEKDGPLADIFRGRVRALLALEELPAQDRAGFEALLSALAPRAMVDLVLLLRFLAREERGVEIHDLVRAREEENDRA